jgi:hypothetical protein
MERPAERRVPRRLIELHATPDPLGVRASCPAGGIRAAELFADEHGEATVFVATATAAARGRT